MKRLTYLFKTDQLLWLVPLMNEVIKIGGCTFKTQLKEMFLSSMQFILFSDPRSPRIFASVLQATSFTYLWLTELCCVCPQDRERQNVQIGNMVEFAIALIGKLDGINRHSFNNFRLRLGKSDYRKLNSNSLLITPLLLGVWIRSQTQRFLGTYCIR